MGKVFYSDEFSVWFISCFVSVLYLFDMQNTLLWAIPGLNELVKALLGMSFARYAVHNSFLPGIFSDDVKYC